MNRRQAKKAFKKKYGVNPPKYERDITRDIKYCVRTLQNIDWDQVWNDVAKTIGFVNDQLESFLNTINEIKYIKEDKTNDGEPEHNEGNADNQPL